MHDYDSNSYVYCWGLGWRYIWKGYFEMITHKFAIVCAEVLREYCDEHFLAKTENSCPNCIFSRKEKPPHAIHSSMCYMETFITGRYGKEHQEMITEEVENRLKELTVNGNKTGDLR